MDRNISIATADGRRMDGYLALPERGSGPGLVVVQEVFGVTPYLRGVADLFAAEGYVTLAPDLYFRIERNVSLGGSEAEMKRARELRSRLDLERAVLDIGDAAGALRAMGELSGGVGVLGFCMGGLLAYLAAARFKLEAMVSYYGVAIEQHLDQAPLVQCPALFHLAANDQHVPETARSAIAAAFAGRHKVELRTYANAGHGFDNSTRPAYDRFSSVLAHSNTIGLLRHALGPRYDLGALWERHTAMEFETHDPDATMATMIEQPYVNHVPVLTGGVGYRDLYRFYKYHFIAKLPADTKIVPVSRTIGPDRLVDELIFCFTHDKEIDFLLPGVAPTGKYVEIPTLAVVQFQGDKLAHEHIYWDQATALVQIGLLDPKRLPVAGKESADKLRDESLPSNRLMARWKESAER